MAHLRFQNFELLHWRQLKEAAFQAEVAPGLVEVDPFLCASSVSDDSSMCHVGKEGSRLFGSHEPLTGDDPSQPSPFYAQDTQVPTLSLLRLQHEVS